jgi:hypothetical protein
MPFFGCSNMRFLEVVEKSGTGEFIRSELCDLNFFDSLSSSRRFLVRSIDHKIWILWREIFH